MQKKRRYFYSKIEKNKAFLDYISFRWKIHLMIKNCTSQTVLVSMLSALAEIKGYSLLLGR